MGTRSIIAAFHGRTPRRKNRVHHRRRPGHGPRRGARLRTRRGAKVWATDLNAKTVGELEGEDGIRTRVLDVTDEAAIQKICKEVGDIDVLFNCAGIVHHGSILDATPKDWDQAFAVNVKSMFLVTRAFLPGMLKKRARLDHQHGLGRLLDPRPAEPLRLRREQGGGDRPHQVDRRRLRRQGIRCNAICPGTVDTPSLQGRINAFADPVQARKDFVARQPMGRLGTVDDITGILVFLASDESLFATGNAYSIDGGMTI